MMEIRLFRAGDTAQIAQLFHDTVHGINARDYGQEQISAWSPADVNFRDWQRICADRFTYVAAADQWILGFAELEKNGHIDCFYCHKDHQRRGIGRQLYYALERKAKELELPLFTVAASITAKPFFEALGFTLVRGQRVKCRGEFFINYFMQKSLICSSKLTESTGNCRRSQ